MRAWQSHELGDPIDVLELKEVPDPEPGPGQVVIDTTAVGLTFPDVLSCRGQYQVPTTFPHTPGGETAGVVREIGDGVEGLEVGDAVTLLGGGLRERNAVAAAACHRYPVDVLTPAEAAALPVNYCTTVFALHDRAQLQAGETVLITGAAGGTGTACIQLSLAAGAVPIAVVGGEHKAELVRGLGAQHVVDHQQTPDWVDTVREISGGGVDVAYDAVGGDAFHQVRRCMAWNGRLLVIGFVGGIPQAPLNHALLKNYSILGVHWGASLMRDPDSIGRQMGLLFDLARQGKVSPALYPPVRFEQAARAIQDMAERKVSGKAVVVLD